MIVISKSFGSMWRSCVPSGPEMVASKVKKEEAKKLMNLWKIILEVDRK